MTYNVDRLIQLRDYLQKHPEQVNMSYWGERTSCGTTMCAAGHAAVTLGGWIPIWDEFGNGTLPATFSRVRNPDTGQTNYAPVVAEEFLGLTEDDGSVLFHLADDEIIPALTEGINQLQSKYYTGERNIFSQWGDEVCECGCEG